MLDALRLGASWTLRFIELALIARVILSWLPVEQLNSIKQVLYTLTEPILGPIRFLISKSIFGTQDGGMIFDISPLIAFIFISALQNYL